MFFRNLTAALGWGVFRWRLASERFYRYRVGFLLLGLVAFMLPSMVSSGRILFDVFVSSKGYQIPGLPSDQAVTPDLLLADLSWKVVVIGIIFCIGWGMILVASKDRPELENVMILISLVLILTSAMISGTMTERCLSDMSCDNFKLVAGIACIVLMGLLAYIISAGVGKRVGWLSLFYLPVLIFQVYRWMPYLLMQNQVDRTLQGVLNSTALLFVALAMAALLAILGGWPRAKE